MRKIFLALGLLWAATPASAQQLPSRVPDHTVVGRVGSGSGSGPIQAIPFAVLSAQLFGSLDGTLSITPPPGGTIRALDISQTSAGNIWPLSYFASYYVHTDAVTAGTTAALQIEEHLVTGWGGQKNTFRTTAEIEADGVSGPSSNHDAVAMASFAVGHVPVTNTYSIGIFGINPQAYLDDLATGYSAAVGGEFDVGVSDTAAALIRFGVLANSTQGGTVGSSHGTARDAAFALGTATGGVGWKNALFAEASALDSTASVIGGLTNSVTNGIDFSNFTFSGEAFQSTGFSVDGSGNIVSSGRLSLLAPITKTNSFTVGANEYSFICNGSGTITVTLPAAASFSGRIIRIKTIAAQTVVSASSNVVPLIGGSAATAILAATAGKWADLQSDGTNWIIMAAN